MRACVCTGVCAWVCVHGCVCVRVCVHGCVCARVCVCTGVCAHGCVCAGVCVRVCVCGNPGVGGGALCVCARAANRARRCRTPDRSPALRWWRWSLYAGGGGLSTLVVVVAASAALRTSLCARHSAVCAEG